jgi:hypothetical protein
MLEIGKRYRLEMSTGTVVIGHLVSKSNGVLAIEVNEPDGTTRVIELSHKAVVLVEPYPWGKDGIIRAQVPPRFHRVELPS